MARAADGWWGLVSWPVYGRGADGILGDLFCSAWIPAGELQASSRSTELPGYQQLLRLDLPADTTAWPVPAARSEQIWYHYGRVK